MTENQKLILIFLAIATGVPVLWLILRRYVRLLHDSVVEILLILMFAGFWFVELYLGWNWGHYIIGRRSISKTYVPIDSFAGRCLTVAFVVFGLFCLGAALRAIWLKFFSKE